MLCNQIILEIFYQFEYNDDKNIYSLLSRKITIVKCDEACVCSTLESSSDNNKHKRASYTAHCKHANASNHPFIHFSCHKSPQKLNASQRQTDSFEIITITTL